MRMERSTLLTAAVLAAVFVAGGFTGAAVATWSGGRADATPGESGAPWKERGGDRRVRDGDGAHREHGKGPVYDLSRFLHGELDLSRDQERRVEAILEERRRRAGRIFEETKERLRSQLDSTVAELKDVLTPGQAAELDSLLERRRKRWEEKGEEGRG